MRIVRLLDMRAIVDEMGGGVWAGRLRDGDERRKRRFAALNHSLVAVLDVSP